MGYAKKRKLQRLTVPKAMLSTIDLNSPKHINSSSPSDIEAVGDEDTDEDEITENEDCSNIAEGSSSKLEERDNQYVFVDDRDEWDFVDDAFAANPAEKAKS